MPGIVSQSKFNTYYVRNFRCFRSLLSNILISVKPAMEKIPFYDLLTILLPGALLTLAIQLFAVEIGFSISDIEMNQYFSLTVFLSATIFLGSFLNFLTQIILPFLRMIGLFTPLEKLYARMKKVSNMRDFYENMMNEIISDTGEEFTYHEKLEGVWIQIYYYLEVNQKIASPKSFQSFYFFFRNFFTMCLFLIFPFVILSLTSMHSKDYILLSVIDLIAIFLSMIAGRWNRKKMVERMFWSYYSLKSNS